MKTFITLISALILTVTINSQNLLNGPDDIVFDAKYNRYLIGNWAGNRIEWNASGLASGVYFYKLITDKHVSIKKMCLLK